MKTPKTAARSASTREPIEITAVSAPLPVKLEPAVASNDFDAESISVVMLQPALDALLDAVSAYAARRPIPKKR